MTVEREGLSYDELTALHDRIIDRLKILDATAALNAMMRFTVGAKVCFESTRL